MNVGLVDRGGSKVDTTVWDDPRPGQGRIGRTAPENYLVKEVNVEQSFGRLR